jgi:anti-sigma regulatory factor (Ser/Thr protein kinase)
VEQSSGVNLPFRGIGEPIWSGLNNEVLAECQLQERLVNSVFAGTGPWQALCPYDVGSLEPAVLAEARLSHPLVFESGRTTTLDGQPADPGEVLGWALPEPATSWAEIAFDGGSLSDLRQFVVGRAQLQPDRSEALMMAASEAAANSVRCGGGLGVLRMWRDDAEVVCEIRDRGGIAAPSAGGCRPPTDQQGGRGLWMANQLCDLVQIRSNASGSVVRIHMRLE